MPIMKIDPYKASDDEVELAQVTEWQWKEEDDILFKGVCMEMLAMTVDEYRKYLIRMEETKKDAASTA